MGISRRPPTQQERDALASIVQSAEAVCPLDDSYLLIGNRAKGECSVHLTVNGSVAWHKTGRTLRELLQKITGGD